LLWIGQYDSRLLLDQAKGKPPLILQIQTFFEKVSQRDLPHPINF